MHFFTLRGNCYLLPQTWLRSHIKRAQSGTAQNRVSASRHHSVAKSPISHWAFLSLTSASGPRAYLQENTMLDTVQEVLAKFWAFFFFAQEQLEPYP